MLFQVNPEAIKELGFKLIKPVRENAALVGAVIDGSRQAIGVSYRYPPVSPVGNGKEGGQFSQGGSIGSVASEFGLVSKKLIVRSYAEAVYADVLNAGIAEALS